MEIYTIGFTRKTAEEFFGILKDNGIRHLLDVRLNNKSQLAGFTKQDDLEFFLAAIGDIAYTHMPDLAPTQELLKGYRDGTISWPEYESRFADIIEARRIEDLLSQDLFTERVVLLCSEPTAEQCHRRLVAEYLQHHWGNVELIHL